MIDITGCDLRKVIQEAYDLSVPQGMGFLHFKPGPLSEEEVTGIWERFKNDNQLALSMDYIKGRAVKLTVFRRDGRLYIDTQWYDHPPHDYDLFLERIGAQREAA